MRALVLEGGAMRGIFTAGVLDALVEKKEPDFDYIVGVSAGACCAASYLAGQHGRNRVVFLEYLTRREFMDPLRLLRGGSLTDMEYLMGDISRVLYPLDVNAISGHPTRFEAVALDARTGRPCYLDAKGPDCLDALHATVSIPVVYRGAPVLYRGRRYFDGAGADPIPLQRALDLGATDVTVVLTKPPSYVAAALSPVIRLASKLMLSKYPAVVQAGEVYEETSRRSRAFLSQPPPLERFRVFMPGDDYPVHRFTRDRGLLARGYGMGRLAVERGVL